LYKKFQGTGVLMMKTITVSDVTHLVKRTNIRMLPIYSCHRGEFQPRVDFNRQSIEELRDNILSVGQLQPIVVREVSNDYYEILAGERRWRAMQWGDLDFIEAKVGNWSDEEAALICASENLQREDLLPMEEANQYSRLRDQFNWTQNEVANRVSKSRSHVANVLGFLELTTDVQNLLDQHREHFKAGHAKALRGLKGQKELQKNLAFRCVDEGWSVRQMEAAVLKAKGEGTKTSSSSRKDPDLVRLETELSDVCGTPITLDISEGGKWCIQAQGTSADLDNFIAILRREY